MAIFDLATERKKIKELVLSIKENNCKIIFTNGCFQILTPAHMYLFKKMFNIKQNSEFCFYTFVGVNSDKSIPKLGKILYKLFTEKERYKLIANIPSIDYVVLFNSSTPYELIKLIQPDIFVKSKYDETWIIENDLRGDKNLVGEIKLIGAYDGRSTTEIMTKYETNGEA